MDSLPRNTILEGDALTRLRELPSDSVDCCISSPPFYALRDYGVTGQIGLEPAVTDWVRRLRAVLREVGRVLKPSGTVWLDLGDSYSRHRRYGAPPKSLLLAPERLALALIADGWLVRNKVIWWKPNAMPSSVTDRLNTTYDVVYLLAKRPRYFFDLDAIRLPHASGRASGGGTTSPRSALGPLADPNGGLARLRDEGTPGHPLGKNPGDVWAIGTVGFRGAHFATFPPKLAERPLLASCPARVCLHCGNPWRTVTTIRREGPRPVPFPRDRFIRVHPARYEVLREDARLVAGCRCTGPTRPGVVLDPFFGTGTVGAVAHRHGRDWLGVELNPTYVRLAEDRLRQAAKIDALTDKEAA